MTDSCGATEGGVQLADDALGSQAVVAGTVQTDGQPAYPAYVRLLNDSGDFVAEVPTDSAGSFRFYAAPGSWTVRVLAPGRDAVQQTVSATRGEIAQVALEA